MASVLLVPSSVTTVPATTLCAKPALAIGAKLATGAELAADAVTLTNTTGLSTFPSFTIKDATKVPAASALKVGLGDVVEDKAAFELIGLLSKTHL